jgi:hypothetical protein
MGCRGGREADGVYPVEEPACATAQNQAGVVVEPRYDEDARSREPMRKMGGAYVQRCGVGAGDVVRDGGAQGLRCP